MVKISTFLTVVVILEEGWGGGFLLFGLSKENKFNTVESPYSSVQLNTRVLIERGC